MGGSWGGPSSLGSSSSAGLLASGSTWPRASARRPCAVGARPAGGGVCHRGVRGPAGRLLPVRLHRAVRRGGWLCAGSLVGGARQGARLAAPPRGRHLWLWRQAGAVCQRQAAAAHWGDCGGGGRHNQAGGCAPVRARGVLQGEGWAEAQAIEGQPACFEDWAGCGGEKHWFSSKARSSMLLRAATCLARHPGPHR